MLSRGGRPHPPSAPSPAGGEKERRERPSADGAIQPSPSPACGRGLGWGHGRSRRGPQRLQRALIRLRHLFPQAGEGTASLAVRLRCKRASPLPLAGEGRGEGMAGREGLRSASGAPSSAFGTFSRRREKERPAWRSVCGANGPSHSPALRERVGVGAWQVAKASAAPPAHPHPPSAPFPAGGRRNGRSGGPSAVQTCLPPLPLAGEGRVRAWQVAKGSAAPPARLHPPSAPSPAGGRRNGRSGGPSAAQPKFSLSRLREGWDEGKAGREETRRACRARIRR